MKLSKEAKSSLLQKLFKKKKAPSVSPELQSRLNASHKSVYGEGARPTRAQRQAYASVKSEYNRAKHGSDEGMAGAIERFAAGQMNKTSAAGLQNAAERGAALAREAMGDTTFQNAAVDMAKHAANWKDFALNTAMLGGAMGMVGAANMGASALEKSYKSLTEGKHKAKAYGEMMKVHKQLGDEDKSKVQQSFNTLWKFNPDAAEDPLLAGSFVQKAVDYGAVTTEEVGKLVSMRKAMRDAESKETTFGAGVGMAGINPFSIGSGS